MELYRAPCPSLSLSLSHGRSLPTSLGGTVRNQVTKTASGGKKKKRRKKYPHRSQQHISCLCFCLLFKWPSWPARHSAGEGEAGERRCCRSPSLRSVCEVCGQPDGQPGVSSAHPFGRRGVRSRTVSSSPEGRHRDSGDPALCSCRGQLRTAAGPTVRCGGKWRSLTSYGKSIFAWHYSLWKKFLPPLSSFVVMVVGFFVGLFLMVRLFSRLGCFVCLFVDLVGFGMVDFCGWGYYLFGVWGFFCLLCFFSGGVCCFPHWVVNVSS